MRELPFSGAVKIFAAILLVVRAELRNVRVDFLSIEAAVTDREKLGRLAALDRGDSDAIEIALIVEAGVLQKFRVVGVDLLRLWYPVAKRRKKRRRAKLRDIGEDNGIRVGGSQRERALSGVGCHRRPKK